MQRPGGRSAGLSQLQSNRGSRTEEGTQAEGRQGHSRAGAELRELWRRMLKEREEASCRAGWATGGTALFTRAAAGRF